VKRRFGSFITDFLSHEHISHQEQYIELSPETNGLYHSSGLFIWSSDWWVVLKSVRWIWCRENRKRQHALTWYEQEFFGYVDILTH